MSLSLPSWPSPWFTAMQKSSRRSRKSFDEQSKSEPGVFLAVWQGKILEVKWEKSSFLHIKYKSWKMMSCHQWFADFVARYLAIINSSINFLIYCLVTACRNISYEAKLCHIFLKHIIVWKPFHTYHIMFTLVSLTNWQQEIPGGDELPGQPDAQHGLPKQHQQRHRHVHRNHILLPQVSPNLINSSVLSKYHPDMSQMFE